MVLKKEMVTLTEVAKLAGVCRSAAGKVLNGTGGSIRVGAIARKKILEAAKKLNYHPNMAAVVLAGGDSRLIGLVLDSHGHYQNLRLLSELEALCAENDYQLITCFSHNNPSVMRRNYSMLMRYGVSGVVCCAHDYPYPELASEIKEVFEGGKRIIFMEKPRFKVENFVETTRLNAFREMIACALELGYRRIGAVHGDTMWASECKLRNEFQHALSDCGIKQNRNLLFQYPDEGGLEKRCDAVIHMILSQKPDFLFVHDAPNAVFLQNRIREANIEITIHGGDDDPIFSGLLPQTGSLNPEYQQIAKLLFETASGWRQKCCDTIEAVFRRNSIRQRK